MKIIQDNWSRRLPLRHKNVASTGAPLKHIMGNEFNIIIWEKEPRPTEKEMEGQHTGRHEEIPTD